jgi:hypothetical protein
MSTFSVTFNSVGAETITATDNLATAPAVIGTTSMAVTTHSPPLRVTSITLTPTLSRNPRIQGGQE